MARSMIARQNLKLNLVPGGVPPVLNVSQNDSAYDVHFTLYNGAQLFEIPDDVSIQFVEKKRDGNGYDVGATKSAQTGQCYIWMQKQMTAVPGDQICELILTNTTEDQIGTANFIMRVEPGPVDDDTSFSDSDIAYANQVLAQLGSVAAYKAQLDAQGNDIDQLNTNLAAEVAARQAADASLQSQINQLIAPEGAAPSAAEVENARVGADGTVYPTLGDAIRGQVTDVKSAIQYQATLNSGYIVYHSGEIKSSSSRHYSEFPVSEGMQVIYKFPTAAYSFGLAFYNTAGKYISGNAAVANTVQTVTVPAGAVLCRATVNTIDDAIPINYNSAISKNREEIEKSVRIDNSGFTYETGKYAYATQASVATYTGINVISFPVYPGLAFAYKYTRSSVSVIGLHFRDSNDAYVSGIATTSAAQTVTTPENAVICYASVSSALDIEFLTVGNSLLSYLSSLNEKTSTGISTTETPLEYLHDDPGMLDIFLHVGCIGDSLASGESYWNDGGEVHGNDFYQYSWGQYLARKTGNTYYNWSRGGMTTKTWLQSEYATECFDGQHLCEAYIIGLGQNDNNVGMTIGTSADIDLANYNNNADTFYGNYGKIIQKIKEVQPQAKIFVITDPNYGMNNNGYNAPIRDMATIFDNVYVIDMQAYGYKYYINTVLNAQMRGSHYNAYGYKVFSVMITNYIDWIVTTHYTEFTQVELIGTGHSWTPSQ